MKKLIFLIILAVLVILGLIISLLHIKLRIKYLHRGNNNHLTCNLSTLNEKIQYQVDFPKIKLDKSKLGVKLEAELEGVDKPPVVDKHKGYSFTHLYQQFIHWYPVIKKYLPAGSFLMQKVTPCKVKWQTELGLFDAAQTGISVGILWALKSMVLAYAYRYMAKAPRLPEIKVIPRFNQKVLVITVDCIFDVKIGYIIIAGLKVFRIFISQLFYKIYCLMRGEFGGRTTTSN